MIERDEPLSRQMRKREWGSGAPVIALHPLGLESSAFGGFGRALARRGMRTIAVDLPGFGQTPAPNLPLTMSVLAQPVIELARRMRRRPAIVGISMGGRVALEAALQAPEQFRSVVAIAPYLPWLRHSALLRGAWILSPSAAERWFPLEKAWPLLKRIADFSMQSPRLRDDEVAQAGARLVYNLSCPATRASFVSAAREMALDPAFGPHGFWTRLPDLGVPAAFVWGGRDRRVGTGFTAPVARSLPEAPQLHLACVAHALNGPHHRCLAETVGALLDEKDAFPKREHEEAAGEPVEIDCLVESEPLADTEVTPAVVEAG